MDNYTNANKIYVDVLAVFNQDGELRPLALKWEDGQKYYIDRVIDVRQAASLKAGGAGIRYTCVVRGKQTYLFFEENRWFIEKR
jgi:hypothetical protein